MQPLKMGWSMDPYDTHPSVQPQGWDQGLVSSGLNAHTDQGKQMECLFGEFGGCWG